MVLAYLGKDHPENELTAAFHTLPLIGTLAENAVSSLEQMGYQTLWFQNANLDKLISLLTYGWSVIVFVHASALPHGLDGIHAIVVIGIEDEQVICLDPELPHELPLTLPRFLAIWAGLDHQGLVIWE